MDPIENFLKYTDALSKGWTHCSYVHIKNNNQWIQNDTEIEEEVDIEEIRNWCQDRCKRDWVVIGGSVLFEDSKDANIFKLMYGALSYPQDNN